MGARDDVLFIGEAGIPEMHVHINESRGHSQTGGLHHLGLTVLQSHPDGGNLSVF